ncbi:cyclin-like protein [Protomyces lactucae-debilis]|uniref:Cyclin-like protein n=1 Tax=Protomyces lactucae-debilis TaxID=2754530 RepID=A0A1Y2FQG4_PROLT|nr:cyclin-like protein [Protomyces lactucae-debilis]ORY86179.1 cyclin-like protein [Protomyces lactucae-debilis]
MAHVRRAGPARAARTTETDENAAQQVAAPAKAKSTRQQSTSSKNNSSNSSSNLLKQGARRAALSDVSNRVPVAAIAGPTKPTVTTTTSKLTRPVRREWSQAPVPALQEAAPLVEEVELTVSDEEDAETGSEVDHSEGMQIDVDDAVPAWGRAAQRDANAVDHDIKLGEPVLRPRFFKEDLAVMNEVVHTFVDEWEEWSDISMVQEYAEDIFPYLNKLERRLTPNVNYMANQTELEWKMRGILIDWLVQVHARFHLLPETLFLTINYIDRFLSAKTVSLQKLQLVGATALFVASKYEEIQCPSVSEVIYMVDNGYTNEELLMAERFMIGMLNFELGWPGPMSFLRRISKADDYDIDTRTIAKYLLETMLMSELFIATPPSFAAAIANYLARSVLGRSEVWTDAHIYFSSYTEPQIVPAVNVLIHECLRDGRTRHGAIFEKYADKKHKKVSLFVEQWLSTRPLH